MRNPLWAKIFAIVLIVFGVTGYLLKMFNDSELVQNQTKEAFKSEESSNALKQFGIDENTVEDEMTKQKVYNDYGKPISFMFVLSGLALIFKAKGSSYIVYLTLFGSIIFAVIRYLNLSDTDVELLKIGYVSELAMSLLVDAILLIYFIFADKSHLVKEE